MNVGLVRYGAFGGAAAVVLRFTPARGEGELFRKRLETAWRHFSEDPEGSILTEFFVCQGATVKLRRCMVTMVKLDGDSFEAEFLGEILVQPRSESKDYKLTVN